MKTTDEKNWLEEGTYEGLNKKMKAENPITISAAMGDFNVTLSMNEGGSWTLLIDNGFGEAIDSELFADELTGFLNQFSNFKITITNTKNGQSVCLN